MFSQPNGKSTGLSCCTKGLRPSPVSHPSGWVGPSPGLLLGGHGSRPPRVFGGWGVSGATAQPSVLDRPRLCSDIPLPESCLWGPPGPCPESLWSKTWGIKLKNKQRPERRQHGGEEAGGVPVRDAGAGAPHSLTHLVGLPEPDVKGGLPQGFDGLWREQVLERTGAGQPGAGTKLPAARGWGRLAPLPPGPFRGRLCTDS